MLSSIDLTGQQMFGSVTLFDNPADLGARVAEEERKVDQENDTLSRWPTFGEGDLLTWRSCVGSAQRINCFGGHIDIVDLSLFSQALRSA